MYTEDQLLPISALQHLLFCPLQCALIHNEQLWLENRLTVEGRHLHRRAHEETTEQRGATWIVRGLPLRSLTLGLFGKGDVVEFTCQSDVGSRKLDSQNLFRAASGSPANWRVSPVEYKRGKPKSDDSDQVQLCAQGLCLEEMLGIEVPSGAFFYGRPRRRIEAPFDESLRKKTAAAARRLHELISSGSTPRAQREPKCDNCSLLSVCLPETTGSTRSMADRVERLFQQHLTGAGPESDPCIAEGDQ